MNIPFSMISGLGNSKATAILVILAGLVIVTALKNTAGTASATARTTP
jgi:hypothetical protein